MSWTRFVIALAIACAVCALRATDAKAQLTEANVLLLYNSENAESLAIRNAYVAARPGVLEYDIDLTYPHLEPNDPQPSGIPIEEINNQFISPEKFVELFLDPGPYQTFLAAHPEILAIATTRGLPAALSTEFDPQVGSIGGAIVASFEGAISGNSFYVTSGQIQFSKANPYFGYLVGFDDYLLRCGTASSEGVMPGNMFLATRLDGGSIGASLDLIARSTSGDVTNPFTGWVLSDSVGNTYRPSARRVWDDNWCVHHDSTLEFLHGPGDAAFNSSADGPYTDDFPTFSLLTLGRHHPNTSDTIGVNYVRHYDADASGVFLAPESFNGWRLHSTPQGSEPGTGQGHALHWIEHAGGYAAFVHVDEPGAVNVADDRFFTLNWYVHRLTWAETAYSAIPRLGFRNTPIGDPLAQIQRVNPDVNNDHIVNILDRALVAARDPSADTNGDGVVDSLDDAIMAATPDRDCSVPPQTSPATTLSNPDESRTYHMSRCKGDFNGDGYIDFLDLTLMLDAQGSICPTADINEDGIVDFADLSILLDSYGDFWLDVDDSGVADCIDAQTVLSSVGLTSSDPAFDARLDLNCDGAIDCFDWQVVALSVDGLNMCGQSCP